MLTSPRCRRYSTRNSFWRCRKSEAPSIAKRSRKNGGRKSITGRHGERSTDAVSDVKLDAATGSSAVLRPVVQGRRLPVREHHFLRRSGRQSDGHSGCLADSQYADTDQLLPGVFSSGRHHSAGVSSAADSDRLFSHSRSVDLRRRRLRRNGLLR